MLKMETLEIETFEVSETSKVLSVTQSVSRLSSACRPTSRCVCRRVYGCAMYASGARGDIADVVERREVGLAQLREAVDDQGAEVGGRLEEVDDVAGQEPLLERLELGRAFAQLHLIDGDRVGLVHHEDQARDLALDRPVVLHLGDGDRVPRRHVAVAVREDADVDVGPVHHRQRRGDRFVVAGRQVFHHGREHALPQAHVHGLLAVLRQVAGGAADHDGFAVGHRGLLPSL